MTAREEDILTNPNYIKNCTVIDILLKSLIVNKKINYNDLLIGDKNAIMVASRILSYGKNYTFDWGGEEQTVDLAEFEPKELDEEIFSEGNNNFSFTLPHTENKITFKMLTHGDEIKIENELKGLKKISKTNSPDVTVRFCNMITSINGSEEKKDIREFVNNYLLARDARELRKYYSKITPDLDLSCVLVNSNGEEEVVDLPIGPNFFWPDY